MNPGKPPKCRICRQRITDPEDHRECLEQGNPWTGRLYRDEPPEGTTA
jgi:hypothetical protein